MRPAAFALLALVPLTARAQDMPGMSMPAMAMPPAPPPSSLPPDRPQLPYVGGVMPVMDDPVRVHAILDQFEDRWTGRSQAFRYSGTAWAGTDRDRLVVTSEATVDDRGTASGGDHELLYSRAATTYFDVRAGVRMDADSGTGRSWAALGVAGLLPYGVDASATLYASDGGHQAAKIELSSDLLITDRLILQPQVELNLYTRHDPGRDIGAGLADLDGGARLRYEIVRNFAPYLGVVYHRANGRGGTTLALGIRQWF